MNKKAQMEGIGSFIVVFLTLLVGIILFTAIAQESGKATTLDSYSNVTVTLPASDGSIYLTNIRAISDVVINNESVAGIIPASNYTIENNVVNNGALAVRLTLGPDSPWSAIDANITGTTQPLTYIPDSGARSMVPLIAIFFALALVVVALVPTMQNDFVKGMIGR